MKLSRQRLVRSAIHVDTFGYRRSWLHIIYVATTGNDTTGNGSKATPYKTLIKAFSVAVAGDGILLANGTYSENTSSSGYWTITKNLTNWLVIEPEMGSAGNVTITSPGTSTWGIYVNGTSSHLQFRDITFSRGGTCDQFVRVNGATLDNIKFLRCTFTQDGATYGWFNGSLTSSDGAIIFDGCIFTTAATAGHYNFYGTPKGLRLINCTLTTTNSGASRCLNMSSTTPTDAMSVSNCTLTGGRAINGNGGAYTISSCIITGTGAASTVEFGVDGQSGNVTTANITNCTVSNTNLTLGHILLFGAGCSGGGANNVTITQAYDYAVVVKECTGVEIQNCNFTSGTSAALYFKAATSTNAHNNVLNAAQGYCFQVLRNDIGGNKCSNWQFQNNTANVSATGKALNIGDSTHDTGGGICDHNTYKDNSGLGTVRSDTNIANLTELQTAWADYDVTTNDSNSTII